MTARLIDTHYRRTAAGYVTYPILEGRQDCDACIIGGGLAGLGTALELARRGQRVVLLEAHAIGWGASGRNGGFVSAGYSAGMEHIRSRAGAADADAIHRLSIEGVGIVRENIARLKITSAGAVPGKLRVLRHEGAAALRAEQALENERFGQRLRYLDREEVRGLLSSDCYHQGLFDPDAFHFHPLNYAGALAAEVVRLGGAVFEGSAAISVSAPVSGAAGMWTVSTTHGSVQAKHVVHATGGYTGSLEPRLRRAYLPIATYVLVTEPLATARHGDLLQRTIRTDAAIADDRRAGDYYRVVEDGRILWGGRITTRTRDPRNLAALLRRQMVSTYPQLREVHVELAWSGLMSYARHLMPQLGRLGTDGPWYATAFGGHGLNTTAIAGRLLAEAITGESDRYRLFAPFGLDWNGGPLGLAAAQLTYWTYQAMDAWHERGNRRAGMSAR